MGAIATPDNLKENQLRAISALLVSGDRSEAAQAAGVARKTLYRWFKDERFVEGLRIAERDALTDVSRRLVALSRQAADVLSDAMRDPDASRGERIRAADIVLTKLLQLRELVALEDRVIALERQMKEQ